jgi:hypothetical protein
LIFARLIDDRWTAFAGAAASPDKLFFIGFFDDRRPCLAVCRWLHPGGAFYEVNPVYFRRAWDMTAKDAALLDKKAYCWAIIASGFICFG